MRLEGISVYGFDLQIAHICSTVPKKKKKKKTDSLKDVVHSSKEGVEDKVAGTWANNGSEYAYFICGRSRQ